MKIQTSKDIKKEYSRTDGQCEIFLYTCITCKVVVAAWIIKVVEGGINIDGGLPTMFKFTYQYYTLFFDGTWCITYQISDRKVAGEAFLRPKHCGGAAPPTEQQQISTLQFSPFLSNTGEPALYLIKLKSEQNVNDVPLNWKLGMDLTIEVKDSEQIEKFEPGRTTQITDDILSLVKRILYEVLWYI